MVNAPTSSSTAIIIGVIAGVLVVLVVAIVALLLYRRHTQRSKAQLSSVSFTRSDVRYAPLDDAGTAAARPRETSELDVQTFAAPRGVVTLQLLTDVVDKGETILQAKRGEIAFVASEDWEADGEWVYGKVRRGCLQKECVL